MSNGPVSGKGLTVTLPPGKTVFWNVTVQATLDQYVVLADPTGAQVFSVSGASPGGHAPTQIGQGSFVVGPGSAYTLYVGVNGGQAWSQVIWDLMTLDLGGATMCASLNVISEDGADQDFNDSAVAMTWFNSLG